MDIFGNPSASAENIYYDNNSSALNAENVQDAIDELKQSSTGDCLSSAISSDNQICRYNGTNNKTIQASLTTIDDLGRIYTANGSSTLPSYSFTAETGSGMYFNPAGADSLGFSLAGASIMTLNPTSVKINQVSRAPDGNATTPAYSFSTDTATGIFNAGSNIMGLSSGGVLKMSVQPTTIEATVPLRLQNGTGNAPSYSFSNASTSGMYYNGTGISLGVSSTEILDIKSTSVTSYAPLRITNGTAGAPSITFAQDLLTGLYASNDIDGNFIGTVLNNSSTPFKVYQSSIQHTGTALIPNIAYDNTISGLTSTTVKTAIDEVKSKTNNLTPTSITTPAITSNSSNADWLVSSSSDYGAGWLPWQAFDNNLLNSAGWNSASGTGYWSNPTGLPGATSSYNFGTPLGTVFGSYVKVDMLTTKQISKYRWASAYADNYPANIKQWKIYVSTDNTNWLQAGERSTDYTRTQGANAWTDYFFLPAPVLAKHIIFMVTKIVGQPTPAGGECHISQIEYANDTPMAYFPLLSVGETAYIPDIAYDNSVSGLNAVSVKFAIDELIPRVFKTTPTDCLIAGTNAGNSITTGTNNILLGNTSGFSLTSGVDNIFVGYGSGYFMTGSDNIAIGENSSRGITGLSTGTYNISMGQNALTDVTSGGNNVCIGGTAGGTIKTGSNNTCIGTSSNVSTEAISNSTALGRGAITTASNECVIGNGSLTHIRASTTNQCDLGTALVGYKDLYLQGNINAIGTTSNISVAGTNKLTLNSSGASVSGDLAISGTNLNLLPAANNNWLTTPVPPDTTINGSSVIFGSSATASRAVQSVLTFNEQTPGMTFEVLVNGTNGGSFQHIGFGTAGYQGNFQYDNMPKYALLQPTGFLGTSFGYNAGDSARAYTAGKTVKFTIARGTYKIYINNVQVYSSAFTAGTYAFYVSTFSTGQSSSFTMQNTETTFIMQSNNLAITGTSGNRLTLNSSGASVNGFVDFMQPCAEMYQIDNSTPTTFTNTTDFFPVLGTFSWNTDVVHHMDVSALGIMQATMSGLKTPYHVSVTISFSTVTNNNQDIVFAVYKNGSIVPGSKIQFYASSNSIRYTTAIHCMPVLNEGDYLRVRARNATNTTGVIVHDINFFAMAMSHTLTFAADSYPTISTPAILGFDTVYYTGLIGYSVPTAGQYTYLQVGPFYYPWRAFDKLDGSTNACALTPANTFDQTFNGVLGGWIRLNITHIVKVSSYRFSTPIDNGEKPAGWRLYSSIDGTTWTLRDTREPFTWNSNGFSGESIINTGVIPVTSFTCKYLVLLITQNGSSNNSAIEEITYA